MKEAVAPPVTVQLASESKADAEWLQKQREQSWILCDCGDSAYSMAVTTANFPIVLGMYSGQEPWWP